jgi:two-component system, NarL family, sensor histidine kinase UhpB
MPSSSPPGLAIPPATGARRSWRWLLRVPLFYKILIANGFLVLVGTIAASLVTARFVERNPDAQVMDLIGGLAALGIVVTLLVNVLILRLALRPLDALERTAARVQRGDAGARVPPSPLADRELDRLTRTFNAMLDAAEANRERLRRIASRALGAAEEERKRIARELHDDTAQSLAAILLRIRLLRGRADPGTVEPLLDELRVQIGDALEGIRRFARGLRPPALDELGLVPAIEAHLRSIRDVAAIAVTLEADEIGEGLSSDAELAVYRIVQEALSNVLRHSGARTAAVRLRREPDRLVVVVEDDGVGFAADRAPAGNAGLGLFGMSERAAYLGGSVAVESAPGTGTRVRAEIPVVPPRVPPSAD